MKTSSNRFVSAIAALLATCCSMTAAPLRRDLPQPLTSRPGNIFVAGEEVVVALPKSDARWRLMDYEGQSLGGVTNRERKVSLGKLGVGFYRLEPEGGGDWISLGVLATLHAPTLLTSPIAMDVAMAWFYPKDRMDAVASLCSLAGVNWVRDRLSWPDRLEELDLSIAGRAGEGFGVRLQFRPAKGGWKTATNGAIRLEARCAGIRDPGADGEARVLAHQRSATVSDGAGPTPGERQFRRRRPAGAFGASGGRRWQIRCGSKPCLQPPRRLTSPSVLMKEIKRRWLLLPAVFWNSSGTIGTPGVDLRCGNCATILKEFPNNSERERCRISSPNTCDSRGGLAVGRVLKRIWRNSARNLLN